MRQASARLALALIAATAALTVPPLRAGAQGDVPAPAAAVSYEGSFHELYTVLARRYPGFELKGIDWAAVGRELLPRARDVHDDASFGLLCMELVGAETEPDRPRFPGPFAVLVDARCVSAGEGWASWFVATGRARLFGEATCGASARKEDHPVRGGLFQVRFPVRFYRGSLDRIIERRGLEPDVPVKPNAADLAAGRDTVLEAARRFVLEGVRD
jgi:hypothetical protein